MLKTTLQRIVTPPPIPAAPPPPTTSTPASVTSQALAASLYLSEPSSASSSVANTRMRCITPHPSLAQVAYVLDVPDQKLSPLRQLVVQNTTTNQVLWKCSMADLVAMLFEFDVNSSKGPSKQAAALRTLGQVQRMEFYDPSTLYVTDMDYNSSDTHFQYLMVQLSQRLVILNCKVGPNSHALSCEQRLTSPRSPFHPVLAHVLETHVKSPPTTMAIPLSPTLLVIGCDDGALRVYDFTQDKVVKSVRGPSGKDSIYQLLSANPYINREEPRDVNQVAVKRILAIGKKGTSYLWEIVMQKGSLIDIRPPLVKMEGTLTFPSTKQQESTSEGSGEAVGDVMEHTLVAYDAHRNYFTWFVPTGYKGSQKGHVFLWDLSRVHALKRKKNVTPKLDPIILSFPTLEGPLTVVSAWLHPAFPDFCLTTAVVTQTGELHIVSMPFKDCKPGRVVKANPYYSDNLTTLFPRDAGAMGSLAPKIRVQSVTSTNRLDTSALLVGSNLGLLILRIDESVLCTGARHAHFGARMAADWNKSCLTVNHSTLVWLQLDIPEANPCGNVPTKNPTPVYKSPPALHLPLELQKRSVRLPPRFLPSPSGAFLCLFWQDEARFEILHLESILRRNDGSYSPAVSSGAGVVCFAWVGDDDVFALLYPSGGDEGESDWSVATKESSTPAASTKVGGARSLKKTFNFIKPSITAGSSSSTVPSSPAVDEYTNDSSRHGRNARVELKVLVPVSANAAEISGSIAAATATIMGDISLRGGNRSPPTTLFGGPVLCVASKSQGSDGGTAHFYTRKPGESNDNRAAAYTSSGPTLPYPDFVEWDDDGRLCAVVVQSRVAIYLSEAPEFVLLGNVQLGSPTEADVTVTGIKFIHGVLYCTTKTTVRCIFLGDLEEGICHLDTFVLASAEGPCLCRKSWSPSTFPFTLNHPIVLGYQSGSLLLSTANGLHAIPLSHPLLRIGSLLAAGQPARAQRWFDMVPECDHEALADFVERRGAPDLAIQLSGLSLEFMIDMCLRFGLTERLEAIIETFGLDNIRRIDYGRGMSVGLLGPEEHGHSVVVCVGAYLLSQGKAELVRRLATECLRSGEEGKQEAFVLASLLLAVDPADARRLVKRAVGGVKPSGRDDDDESGLPVPFQDDENAVLALIRNHILQ